MTIRKWRKVVGLQKVKDAHSQEVCHNADVIAEVEAVPKMNALIAVL